MDTTATAILHADRVGKRYGGIVALDRASLSLHPGEVHALLGANGAGKSTLMKILAGMVRPDEGGIVLRGRPVAFDGPQDALRAGVATVHQELSLFPQLSVAQNVLIGRERLGRLGWIRERASIAATRELLAELDAPDIAPDAPIGDLSLARMQLVEIAKAMSARPEVLILDEPTSALGPADVERLFRVVERLQGGGCAVVFISHRMEEIRRLADRVTVLRAGVVVGTRRRDAFDPAEALELMLGETREQLRHFRPPSPDPAAAAAGPLLAVGGLSVAGRLHEVELSVRPGEVVGLAGLEGQGQKELLHALFGVYRHGVSGTVRLRGRDARARSPAQAVARSFAFVPDDRKAMGGFLDRPVGENVAITVLDRVKRAGLVDRRREDGIVRGMIERLRIRCAGRQVPLGSLSGGNQQKVVAAKWLARGAEVFLLCDPTRGVDAGAREIIYATIRDLAASGAAVLVYSTDLDEFSVLCSRVLVLRGGRITGELADEDITEENILSLSFREPAMPPA